MKRRVVYLFLSLFILLAGCEYETGENLVELEVPSADDVHAEIELWGVPVGEQIYIEGSTSIAYSIRVPGYRFLKCEFEIDDQKWEMEGASGDFYVNTDHLSNGMHELSCRIYLKTNSGSLLDQANGEAFIGEKTWPVKVFVRETGDIPLAYRVNEEGYIELSWETEEDLRAQFDHYRIVYSKPHYSYERKIGSFDSRTFVDRGYVGEACTYEVFIYFKDESIRPYSLGKTELKAVDPQVKIEHLALDKVRLSWNNPYRSVASVYYKDKLIVDNVPNGSSVDIPIAGFSDVSQWIELRFKAFDVVDRWMDYTYVVERGLELGVPVTPNGNWPRYGYNLQEDRLYVSSYNEVTSWRLPDCSQVAQFNSTQQPNVEAYAFSVYDTRMAALHAWGIEIFENSSMKQATLLSVEHPVSFTGRMALTKDGKLITFLNEDTKLTGIVYDVSTAKEERRFALPEGLGSVTETYVTPDAKYMYYEYKGELSVAGFDNYQCHPIGKLSAPFTSWCLDLLHSERLFVSDGNKVTMYDCSNNFSALRTFSYPELEVRNVDPKTGYLLLANRERFVILNPQIGDELLSGNVDTSYLWLYGNTLCAGNGYALNLDNYIQK